MKAKIIARQLEIHAPFTALGTVTGIMIMAVGERISLLTALVIAVFLFSAVWIPCCTSDIVFPLLWVKKDKEK